jgi:hypothetical protein
MVPGSLVFEVVKFDCLVRDWVLLCVRVFAVARCMFLCLVWVSQSVSQSVAKLNGL